MLVKERKNFQQKILDEHQKNSYCVNSSCSGAGRERAAWQPGPARSRRAMCGASARAGARPGRDARARAGIWRGASAGLGTPSARDVRDVRESPALDSGGVLFT